MKLKAVLLILAICLLPSAKALANETLIQGEIKDFEGAQIRLGYYQDYITFKKVFVASDVIEEGKFQLKVDLDNVKQLILMVEDKQSSFFAEPGQVYNLSLSYNIENNAKRAFEKYLDLHFSFPKAEELNQKIKQFNNAYQDFFADNYEKFVVNNASKEIDAFIKEQSAKGEYQSPEYLNNYVRYALANLKDINKAPTNELEKEYLLAQDVLIQHKEYMNFFRQLYEKDFEQLLITKAAQPLMKEMMFDQDLDSSLAIVKQLKGFDSQELTELYFINGLFEVYHLKTVNQKSSLILLDALSKKGSTQQIKELAKAVRERLEILAENKNAPDFKLKDSEGIEKSLSDFKGKPIYMSFWANWSIISLKELRLMQALEEKYGDQIQFISINIDEEEEPYKSVKSQFNFDWTFLYGGRDYLLREQYEVKTVPVYFLIDKDGTLIQRYAPAPQQVEPLLDKLLDQGSK
jgi:thiol-disulfide isomerase/thioredoxin